MRDAKSQPTLGSESGTSSFGFGVSGLGFGVWGLGFRAKGLGLRVLGSAVIGPRAPGRTARTGPPSLACLYTFEHDKHASDGGAVRAVYTRMRT